MRSISILATTALVLAVLAGPALSMTVDEVIQLLDNGIGEQVIQDQMAADSSQFALTSQNILDLKDAGASDDLIRRMIQTGAGLPRSGDWTQPYYSQQSGTSSSLAVRLYYDPFGYNWYAWPYNFAYYYPFEWGDCGAYYAGWWNTGWRHRGPWTNYYWNRYHWDHWPGPTARADVWARGLGGGRGIGGHGPGDYRGRTSQGHGPRQITVGNQRPNSGVPGQRQVERRGNERTPWSRSVRPGQRDDRTPPATPAEPSRPAPDRPAPSVEPSRPAPPESTPAAPRPSAPAPPRPTWGR